MTLVEDPIGPRIGAASWGLGATGSLLANMGLVACVIVSLQPQEISDRDRPQSELQVTSQTVRKSDATAVSGDAADVPPAEATSNPVASSTVPQSSAEALLPEKERLVTRPANGSQIAASAPASIAVKETPTAPPVTSALSGKATPIDSARTDPTALASLTPEALSIAVSETQAARAKEVAAPPIDRLQEAQLAGTPLPAVAATPSQPLEDMASLSTASAPPVLLPPASPVAALAPDPLMLEPEDRTGLPIAGSDLPAEVLGNASADDFANSLATVDASAPSIRASLAFPAPNASTIDPQSLAVFQQFQDPGPGGETLRDGLAGIVSAIPCARVQLSFDPDTATLELRGHLPEDYLRAPVLAALQSEMGQDIVLQDEMRLLPQPQCGALAGISDVGLPQSTDQITNPLLVGEDTHARVLSYAGGDRLFFDLTAPDYAAYVYVDYFDAGGSVLHLLPNAHVALAKAAPMSRFRVGAKDPADAGLMITVGPPYGQEIAVAFAASHPLFPDQAQRPLQEPAAPYLDELKTAVSEAREAYPEFKGEWVYFLVTTQEP
ncbi:MAG: hypothetical protein BM562_01580 [Alphaproteobacteria bacterium MedPE-SWcel]|mgnify:CR=1 FL=1|nr:MAG: hypothetical protein BM562_01580 [Alphaproteobacteria bacterium MedPE-SWcel]